MIADEIREKLQNIVRGALLEGKGDNCTKIRNLLVESFGTSPTIQKEFESRTILKEKQASFLRLHAKETGQWLPKLPSGSLYVTRGEESQIYLADDILNVIKVNEAIYYATWAEYFNSIVSHNLLFPSKL
jgi:hypothetical protein